MTSTTPITRRPILQMDLINNKILIAPADQTGIPETNNAFINLTIDAELKESFLSTVGSFWHNENDKLEFFGYYNDGTYYCQRNRLRYDFKSTSNYWAEYSFKGATVQQANDLYVKAQALFAIAGAVKSQEAIKRIEAVEKELDFFETKWLKRIREKKLILASSDWRILPDVVDSYEGEKQRWIDWRAKIRSLAVANPEEFDTPLDFAKSLWQAVYPIDPKNYRKIYPNDMLEDGVTPAPAFMDPDDPNQWTKYDDDASSDFLDDRMINRLIYAKQRGTSPRKVKKDIFDAIKLMQAEAIYPDFDMSLFQIEE